MPRGGENPPWAPGQREPRGEDKGVSGITENLKEVSAEPRNTTKVNPKAGWLDDRARDRDVQYLGHANQWYGVALREGGIAYRGRPGIVPPPYGFS